MVKHLEDLIFEMDGNSDGRQTTYEFTEILEALKLVRESTMKECAEILGKNHVQRHKDFILFTLNHYLDKNSIKIYELH